MHDIKQVCVYCASSALTPQVYLDAVDVLAADLVAADIKAVFGGGSTGLMGRLADQMLMNGGRIAGIMPDFMREVEWAHKSLTELQFVADMHARKKQFLVNTDALIALPGGSGTLEELLEAITWKRLGLFVKPIVILNLNGFYDPLLQQLARCVEEKFMTAAQSNMWTVVKEPGDILSAARNASVWTETLQNARVH